MFLKLFSIEWIRLTRRSLLWLTLTACAAFTWLSLQNFYTPTTRQLLDGSLKMPGLSFDLANSLDHLLLIDLPFLVILAGGRARQRLRPAHQPPLADADLAYLQPAGQVCLAGGGDLSDPGLCRLAGGRAHGMVLQEHHLVHASPLANVNWLAVISAALYMTLVRLPYAALMLLIVVVTRSTFRGHRHRIGLYSIHRDCSNRNLLRRWLGQMDYAQSPPERHLPAELDWQ